MTAEILTDAVVVIDGFDFQNFAKGISIDGDAEMIEVTGFGDTGRRFLKSILSFNAVLDYTDDYADNSVNEKIYTWWTATTSFLLEVTKKTGSVSASNPKFSGNVFIVNPTLLNAQFGAAPGGQLRLQGDGGLTRAVS